MNQPSSDGPDEPSIFESALSQGEELYQLTKTILTKSLNPNLPELGQLVLRRSILIAQLQAAPLAQFTAEQQTLLTEKLEASKRLDIQIEQNMQRHQQGLDHQIKELKEAKSLVGKYKLPEDPNQGTHSRNA